MPEINPNVSPDYTIIDIPDKSEPIRQKIRKVPQQLRQEKNNQQEYDPMVVSIGPYHHGKEELRLAEDFKIKCLELFVADSGIDKESLYAIVRGGVNDWRNCYIHVPKSRYDDQKFAQMMLLDACFIINYVLTDQYRRNRIVTINGLGHLFLPLIQRDLFLLENQIPFTLLMILIFNGYGQTRGEEMLCIYFKSTIYGDYNPNGIASSIKKQHPFHLLDAFRLMLVPTTPPEQPNKSGIINKICTSLLENIAIFPSQWCKLRWSTTRKDQEEVGSAPRKPLSCIESLSPPDKHLVEEEHKRLRPRRSAPRKPLSCIESLPLPDKDRVVEEYKRPSVGSTTRKHQEEVEINDIIVGAAPQKPLSCIESLPPPDKHLVEEEYIRPRPVGSAPRKPLSCIESLPLPDKHRVEEEYKRPSVGSTTRKHQEEVGFIELSAPRKPMSAPRKPPSCIKSLPPPDKHHDKEEFHEVDSQGAPQKPEHYIELQDEEKYNAKKWVHSFRSASELKSRGIHFRPSKENSLMSIKFHPGTFFATLELPVWFVSMDNKVFFLNMIAYELCPGACTDQVVTAYIELMKKLIDNPNDVKELREQGILLITSGNDEDVVKVYKELNTYGIDSVEVFQKTKNDIQDHYGSKGKTWLAELIYVYFRTPWTVITLLAATILLILTIIQTYFTIHPR